MTDPYGTGSEGEQLLADHLRAQGRVVEPSDTKTFDLRVDGQYAEVKSSRKPYAQLGFIGLTQGQYSALEEGLDFLLFIVCNLDDPANIEVIEIPSDQLLRETPTVECTYYWYRSQLDGVRRARPPSGEASGQA